MLALLPLLITLLSHGTDILPRCLSIFESYLLLDSPAVVSVSTAFNLSGSGETGLDDGLSQACASPFFASIHDLLEGLKLDAVKVILHALNTVYLTAPPSSWAAALDSSGCFATYLKVIGSAVRSLHVVIHMLARRAYACLVALQEISALIVTKCTSTVAALAKVVDYY